MAVSIAKITRTITVGSAVCPPRNGNASSVVEVGHCHCSPQPRAAARLRQQAPLCRRRRRPSSSAVFQPSSYLGRKIDEEETFGAEAVAAPAEGPAARTEFRPGFRGGVVIVANGAAFAPLVARGRSSK